MLTITVLEPPNSDVLCSFVVKDGERVFEKVARFSWWKEPFEHLDQFICNVATQKEAYFVIDDHITRKTEDNFLYVVPSDDFFIVNKYDNNWNVILEIIWHKGTESEERFICALPTYNIIYEFGKLLAIKSWLKYSHANYKEIPIESVENWKKQQGLY